MSAAAHPSRSAPLCRDCRHNAAGFCDHPAAPRDLVRGEPAESVGFMRVAKNSHDGPCGPEGRLFALRQDGLQVGDVAVERVQQHHAVAVEGQGVQIGGYQLGAALRGFFAQRLFDAADCNSKPSVGLQDGLGASQVGDGSGVHEAPLAAAAPRAQGSASWSAEPHRVGTQAQHAHLVDQVCYLEFYDWQCGHHQACPDPVVGVASATEALLIARAIGAAISQPGHCSARWVGPAGYVEFYITDDYAEQRSGGELDLPVVLCDPTGRVPLPERKPGVFEQTALFDLEDHLGLLTEIEPGWNGSTALDGDAAVLTSLSVDQVHALTRTAGLPPLRVLDVGAVLDEMLADQEAEPEPLPEDGRDDGRSTRHYPPLEG